MYIENVTLHLSQTDVQKFSFVWFPVTAVQDHCLQSDFHFPVVSVCRSPRSAQLGTLIASDVPRVCGSLNLTVVCLSTTLLCLPQFYSPWHQFGRIVGYKYSRLVICILITVLVPSSILKNISDNFI